MGVAGAGERTVAVIYGPCRAVQLLHFAAAAPRGAVLYRPSLSRYRCTRIEGFT